MTTIPAGVDATLDAERMRALCSCPRIRMHGSAGVHPGDGRRLYADEPGQVHFGADLMLDDADDFVTAWGRFAIAAIAEDRLAVEGADVPDSAIGDSEADDAARFGALMRLPRIRVMRIDGGGDDEEDPVANPSSPGAFGFRAEFWPTDPSTASAQCEPTLGRRCLLVLADDLVAARDAAGG